MNKGNVFAQKNFLQIDLSMIDPTIAHPRKQIENNKSRSYKTFKYFVVAVKSIIN